MAAVQHPPRTHLRRPSPFSSSYRPRPGTASATAHGDVSDSDSDDEPPPAIKFSKVTEALLNERPIISSPIKHDINNEVHRPYHPTIHDKLSVGTPSRSGIKILRQSSPFAREHRGSTPPRIVHIGSAEKGSARRTISISGPYPHKVATKREPIHNPGIVTPAPSDRVLNRTRASSITSQDGHVASGLSSSQPASRNTPREFPDPIVSNVATALGIDRRLNQASDVASRLAPSTINRAKVVTSDSILPPGSQRTKRGPIATGTFLKSGPVRRGFRRRDSEENVSPTDEHNNGPQSAGSSSYTPIDLGSRSDGFRSWSDSGNTRATSVEPVSVHDFAHEKPTHHARPSSRQSHQQSAGPFANAGRLNARQDYHASSRSRQASEEPGPQVQSEPYMRDSSVVDQHNNGILPENDRVKHVQTLPRSLPSIERHHRGYNSILPTTEAADDQENVPPPTFRRNKDQEFKFLGRSQTSLAADGDKFAKVHATNQSPIPSSQPLERKPLISMSNNTPYRAAPPPPPPKMTVLETVTATAGASTTKSRKKRTHVVLNGKIFTQMGKIGKGGSSDVYCVMAENFKTFAMKKVKLEDCDESAVRGYKGEIDLLKKLTDVERVIRLYDWELNDEKQELNVLMEKGDTDLNRLLSLKLNAEDAKFDGSFTRYHWKEMLECVQAVHEHDIVHSDLKPANFLVVQGKLKLIDFGIANAIDIDNTCNVHRDSHVGTPNYMSPESITDTNAAGPGFSSSRDAQGRPLKKDMRIGKPSDVWSLGCILYQMTYGRPPFAHIANQISRIMAITNPKHNIEFPSVGLGGVRIPSSLKRILRRCLQRDADLRPTVLELLADTDEFLNPEANGSVMIRQEVLDQIIHKIVDRCRDSKRGLPSQVEIAQYAPSFMLKIREMAEKA